MRNLFQAGFVIFVCALPSLATVDTGLLALLPAESRVVGGIDVEGSRSSEFGQFVLGKIRTGDSGFENFVNETGFDPRRDLQAVLFGGFSPSASTSRSVLLLRGNFDQERIKAKMIAKGVNSVSFQGVAIYSGKTREEGTAFAFPEIGVAAVGDLVTLHEVIANRASPSILDSHLQMEISAAGASNNAWFVSLTPGSSLAQRLQQEAPPQMRASQVLQSVLESSGGVALGSSIQLTVNAIARSAKDATSLTDVVRFGVSVLQMQRDSDPRVGILASALDKMELTAVGDAVHISVQLPETSLEQLAQNGIGLGVSPRH